MSKLKIIVSLLWLLLTGAICFNIYSAAAEGKEFYEALNMFLLMLGGYGVIITILNHSETLADNNEQLKKKFEIDKIENTFKLLKAWDDEHLFKARKLTREIKDRRSSTSDDDLIKEIDSSDELQQSVILVFNYIENVRFSIKTGRIDCGLFRASLGTAIKDIIRRFEPYAKKLGDETYTDMQECSELLN